MTRTRRIMSRCISEWQTAMWGWKWQTALSFSYSSLSARAFLCRTLASRFVHSKTSSVLSPAYSFCRVLFAYTFSFLALKVPLPPSFSPTDSFQLLLLKASRGIKDRFRPFSFLQPPTSNWHKTSWINCLFSSFYVARSLKKRTSLKICMFCPVSSY